MHFWLVQHNLQSIRRSPEFRRKLTVNIVFGFFVTIIALELMVLGIYLNDILTRTAPPGTTALDRVNGVLLLYFAAEFVMRLVFQKYRSADARHYLLHPVGRDQITHFVLLKTLGTVVNILPLLVVLPFFFMGVTRSHAFLPATAWLLTFLSLMIANTYLATYAKLTFFKNAVWSSTFDAVVVGVLVLEKLGWISLSPLSRLIFGAVLIHPFIVIVPVLLAAGFYLLDFRFLRNRLYLDDFAIIKSGSFREQFPLLAGFGEMGTLIALDIKLMLRNKRARISLYMPFLMVFYGLFFYPSGRFHQGSASTDFMLLFVGAFITGFFIISYGISTFCYESKHFSLILTNRIDMFTYLKARYFFMLLMTLPVYLVSLFYAYYGTRIVIINSLMFLFNIGFTSFVYLFFATYNKLKFDLSAGMYSTQGKGSNQFIAIFILMGMIAVPFFTIRSYAGPNTAFVVLGLIGVVGFIFHNSILTLLVRQFERRKYIMSEGFRAQ